MSIFQTSDYRKFLQLQIEERKKRQPGFTQTRLAQLVGMQNTYLTNVLKGRANFNSDQIYAVAKHLKLSDAEASFLQLLKEYDQSVSAERKQDLKNEIEERRQKAQRTESRITAKVADGDPLHLMKYYGDPYLKVVHVLLQIPRYAKNPESIAEELNLRLEYLKKLLATLQELGVIKYEKKAVIVLKKNYHLPKDSPMLLPHQALMRARSAERLQQVPAEDRYSFSVTLSTTEETRQYIHDQFLDFLKKIEREVKANGSENAYQINFDLFPWNKPV